MVDILVILAHPDDAELCCAGTLLSSIEDGLKVGMVDLRCRNWKRKRVLDIGFVR